MLGEENTIAVLSKMMELSTRKHQVIANNIANANTPGYIRREMTFQNEMKMAINTRDWHSLKSLSGTVSVDTTNTPRNDGNNISLTQEMNEMSQNGILYELTQKAFKSRVGIIKKAIR